MSDKDREIERLIRLRERQLQARDPHAKERKFERRDVARRRRKADERLSLGEILGYFPHKFRLAAVGALIGLLILIALPLMVEALLPGVIEIIWLQIAGLVSIVVLAMIGWVIGSSFDWRDELRDF